MGTCNCLNTAFLEEQEAITETGRVLSFATAPSTERGNPVVRITRGQFVASYHGSVHEHYYLDEEIGYGSYGVVFRATHIKSGEVRAIKIITKSKLSPSRREKIVKEAEILRSLDHPNIIRIYEVIVNDVEISIVTELCTGGNLFERIIASKVLTEQLAARYMAQLFSSLIHCHRNQVVHRDLKPENILFESKSSSMLKIIDFGISTKLSKDLPLSNFLGTVYYMAPEVIQGRYTEKCDLWSCGVILYMLLSGKPPFNGKTKVDILYEIRRGHYSFEDMLWNDVSEPAKDLVRGLLTKDPELRLSAELAYNHPWIRSQTRRPETFCYASQRVLHNLTTFQTGYKIREATLNYIVCQMVNIQEVQHLRDIFCKLDTDGDGKLSVEELETGFERLDLKGSFDLQYILTNCDADGNGFIDYSEFLTASLNWSKALSQERLERAFKAYDIDQNGKISLEEMKTFIGDQGEGQTSWQKLFEQADLNQDGFIDLEEFKQLMLSSN